VDVGKANIIYSLAANWIGPNFAKVQGYRQECLAGRTNLQDAKYAEPPQHLAKADELINGQHDLTQAQWLKCFENRRALSERGDP
jgi:hypothetical protein